MMKMTMMNNDDNSDDDHDDDDEDEDHNDDEWCTNNRQTTITPLSTNDNKQKKKIKTPPPFWRKTRRRSPASPEFPKAGLSWNNLPVNCSFLHTAAPPTACQLGVRPWISGRGAKSLIAVVVLSRFRSVSLGFFRYSRLVILFIYFSFSICLFNSVFYPSTCLPVPHFIF